MFSQCTNLIVCIDCWAEKVGIELKQKCTQNANDERRNGQEAKVQSSCPIPGITQTNADTRSSADMAALYDIHQLSQDHATGLPFLACE